MDGFTEDEVIAARHHWSEELGVPFDEVPSEVVYIESITPITDEQLIAAIERAAAATPAAAG